MKRFLQAKGRLKVGEMNRTEAAYRDYLEQQKNCWVNSQILVRAVHMEDCLKPMLIHA